MSATSAAHWKPCCAEEHDTTRAQQQELDAKLKDLLDASQLDKAEVALAGIFWRPVTPGSHVDRDFVRQYDERREALAKIIESRRKR